MLVVDAAEGDSIGPFEEQKGFELGERNISGMGLRFEVRSKLFEPDVQTLDPHL